MISSVLKVRIPIERVGVLIGPSGKTKNIIEEKLGVQLTVEGKTGDIDIAIKPGGNPGNAFQTRDIVMAIGRGFSAENALLLFDEDVTLVIVDLREYFGRSVSDIQRVKGRIIGANGKVRRNVEEFTGTRLSIYGHTVAILGDLEHCEVAKEALNMLIRGSLHKSVYRFLEAKRAQLRKVEAEIWKTSPEVKG